MIFKKINLLQSFMNINSLNLYLIIYVYQMYAGQSQNIKRDNKLFERVEQFKCLGTTQTNQNSTQEKLRTD